MSNLDTQVLPGVIHIIIHHLVQIGDLKPRMILAIVQKFLQGCLIKEDMWKKCCKGSVEGLSHLLFMMRTRKVNMLIARDEEITAFS